MKGMQRVLLAAACFAVSVSATITCTNETTTTVSGAVGGAGCVGYASPR